MMRFALPKSRTMKAAAEAFGAVGIDLTAATGNGRQLRVELPEHGFELLLLKDWDLPLYVEYGIADFGLVGTDVMDEVGGDLLMPVRLLAGRCRMSLIGYEGTRPEPGSQVRLATKYPRTARRWVAERSWGAEVLELSGSIELAPLLDLAEVAVDIVQTGQTLVDNGLVELEPIAEVATSLVINRASYQRHRTALNDLLSKLERAGVAE